MNGDSIWFKLASALAAGVLAAFLAWAGVVWSAWQDISSKLFAMMGNMSKLEIVIEHYDEKNQRLERQMDEHRKAARAWHEDAGKRLQALEHNFEMTRGQWSKLTGEP